jgi:hypothetical protein
MDLAPSDDREDPLIDTSQEMSPRESSVVLRFWLLLSDRDESDKADDKADNDIAFMDLSFDSGDGDEWGFRKVSLCKNDPCS